jgi:hypothetical protein
MLKIVLRWMRKLNDISGPRDRRMVHGEVPSHSSSLLSLRLGYRLQLLSHRCSILRQVSRPWKLLWNFVLRPADSARSGLSDLDDAGCAWTRVRVREVLYLVGLGGGGVQEGS